MKKELSKSAQETIGILHELLDSCRDDEEFIKVLIALNNEVGRFMLKKAVNVKYVWRDDNEQDYIG